MCLSEGILYKHKLLLLLFLFKEQLMSKVYPLLSGFLVVVDVVGVGVRRQGVDVHPGM